MADLTADDIVVVGEMFGAGAIAVRDTPARKVLHNQGPFYTFKAFTDLTALRAWGCEAIITPSVFAAHMVSRMGWDRPLFAVHPALDPVFAAAGAAGGPRHLRIATIANRRPDELRLIHGIVRSRRPDLARLPWYDIRGASRAEVARQMAASEIFLALGHLEGLGLPPLEAMAAGALVVGFYGGGGQEYATAENGDWFQDGAHFEIAQTLIRRIDQLRGGETFAVRRAAGRQTVEDFSQEAFETGLAAAWRTIAGPPR
jgi:glycosyltransferase involved in cell wall biosynthesis